MEPFFTSYDDIFDNIDESKNKSKKIKKIYYNDIIKLTYEHHMTLQKFMDMPADTWFKFVIFDRNFSDNIPQTNEFTIDEAIKYNIVNVKKTKKEDIYEGDEIEYLGIYIENYGSNHIIYHTNFYLFEFHFIEINIQDIFELHIECSKNYWMPLNYNGNIYNEPLIDNEIYNITNKLEGKDNMNEKLKEMIPLIYKKNIINNIKNLPLTTRIGWRGPMILYDDLMTYNSGYNYDTLILFNLYKYRIKNTKIEFLNHLYQSKQYFNYYLFKLYMYKTKNKYLYKIKNGVLNLIDNIYGKEYNYEINLKTGEPIKLDSYQTYTIKLYNKFTNFMISKFPDNYLSDTDNETSDEEL